jgi:hypothetical protein
MMMGMGERNVHRTDLEQRKDYIRDIRPEDPHDIIYITTFKQSSYSISIVYKHGTLYF